MFSIALSLAFLAGLAAADATPIDPSASDPVPYGADAAAYASMPTTMVTSIISAAMPIDTSTTVLTKPAAPVTSVAPGPSTVSTVITPQANEPAPLPAQVYPGSPSKDCPLVLAGTDFQFPHLIVTSNNGANTGSTQYNGNVGSTVAAYFNFDIPPSYRGRLCNLIFSLPRQDQLQTSAFQLGGVGNLVFGSTRSPALENSVPPLPFADVPLGSWTPVPGQATVLASGPCAAGQRVGYSITAEGDRSLEYFQDYNPCPIGLYIVAQ